MTPALPRDQILTATQLLQDVIIPTYGLRISRDTLIRWLQRSGVEPVGPPGSRPRYSLRKVQRWLELQVMTKHTRESGRDTKAPSVRAEVDSAPPSEQQAEALA